jgi:hypothetical protein
MGQRVDGNEGAAENNNSWSDVNLTNLPLSEVKPLYRLIFAADSNSYTNVPKCRLMSILDIRVAVISTIAGVTQNDHGSLFGLGDDDHSQYLHVDNNRTVNAIHDFVNGLTVNGASVSVSGHSHTSSDITNFNSSVSGLISGIYAPLSSPTLTGIPLTPTASSGTNTNQIASTSFVRTEISNLVASAPSTLDTLNELASALGNDTNFSTTVTNSLANKAALSGATFTGSISSPSGNFTQSLSVNGTGVSISGHTHTASAISDSTTAGRALLTGVDAAAQRTSLGLGSIATLSSGTYALVSHTHTSSDITNFNSSVSGLLPVKDIVAGSNVTVSSISGTYTINSTGGGGNGSIADPYDLGTYPLITISSQPSGTSVAVSGTATFSVTAAATLPSGSINYQWQESSDNSTWSNISGSTSNILTLSNVQSNKNNYYYRCNLQSVLSNINSNSAQLTVSVVQFSAMAVILTSGSSYTVPAGATSMKAWAVGGGGGTSGLGAGAGGTSFKTWSVSGGSNVAYTVGNAGVIGASPTNGGNSTVTYGGTTITGSGGASSGTGGGYSGGDGGANGGGGTLTAYPYRIGGAVGGNSQSILICAGYGEAGRRPATDVSGLQAAVTLAGGTATQACGSTAAFGSSAHGGEKNAASQNAGLGGGAAWDNGQGQAGSGAVVLYFT